MADEAAAEAGGHASEDELDRALRALTEGTAGQARFRELSAAERAKAGAAAAKAARQLAEERARAANAERKQARRRRGGWDEPARPRGGRARVAVALIAALALAGAGLYVLQRYSRPIGGGVSDSHSASSGPTPSGTAGDSPAPAPAPAAAAPAAAAGPPADPFTGTPADHWAIGAAGIIIPAAKPVGPYSTAQVAAAYKRTRKLLIAALLDRQTFLGGPPTAFANLLTAKQRDQFLAGLNTRGTTKNQQPLSTRAWVVSFAPGSAELIGSVIKVSGSMKAEVGHENGQEYLYIDVSYTSVYPVEPPGKPSDWMRIVADKYGAFAFAHFDTLNGPLEPWDSTVVGDAGGKCPRADGYIHPDYPSLGYVEPSQPGPAIDPYNVGNAPTRIPTQGSGNACEGTASYT